MIARRRADPRARSFAAKAAAAGLALAAGSAAAEPAGATPTLAELAREGFAVVGVAPAADGVRAMLQHEGAVFVCSVGATPEPPAAQKGCALLADGGFLSPWRERKAALFAQAATGVRGPGPGCLLDALHLELRLGALEQERELPAGDLAARVAPYLADEGYTPSEVGWGRLWRRGDGECDGAKREDDLAFIEAARLERFGRPLRSALGAEPGCTATPERLTAALPAVGERLAGLAYRETAQMMEQRGELAFEPGGVLRLVRGCP